FEYHLTEKGLELAVALLALMQWGDSHLSEKPPSIARRRSDRAAVSVRIVADDGSAVAPHELEFVPGPGLKPARTGRNSSSSTRSGSPRPARTGATPTLNGLAGRAGTRGKARAPKPRTKNESPREE